MDEKRDGAAPAFPAKPIRGGWGCPTAGMSRSCCCCTRRERRWGARGAKGVLVVPPSTAASPFQPCYAFKVPTACPQKTRKELLRRSNGAIRGASGNGFGFGIKVGPMAAWGEGIVTTVNV